jgi:hypothetical protein
MRPAPYHLQETGDLDDPGPSRWLPQHRHRCGAVLVQGQADGASTQYLELPFALALALINDGCLELEAFLEMRDAVPSFASYYYMLINN